MVFYARLAGFRIYFIKSPGKNFPQPDCKTAKIPEIYNPHCFRYSSAIVCNELYRMGDPFFCKYICPQGVLEGAIPRVTWKYRYKVCTWNTFSFKCLILITVVVLSICFTGRSVNGSVLLERSIHYLIRSAFLILKLKAANVSDAINVQRHVKWILMCARLRIIQNVYDAGLASRFVQKMRSNISFWEKHAPKKNSSNQP